MVMEDDDTLPLNDVLWSTVAGAAGEVGGSLAERAMR
jgi:hypothetical protein